MKNGYKIPIVTSYSNFIKNEIVVANFEQAFQLEVLEQEEWEDKRLCIDVSAPTEAEAKIIYEQDMEKWKDKNGIKLSQEDAIYHIQNTINLKVFSKMKLNIIDKNAFEVMIVSMATKTN